jgi:hypothetical protein
VTNTAAIQTNYQVKLTVAYDADMKADFGDIRFTNSTGTALNYWVQSQTNSTSAIVWVKVDSLAATGDTTLYIYYGNAAASTASNGGNTFNFFDDFNDGTIDGAKWTEADAGNKITKIKSLQFLKYRLI